MLLKVVEPIKVWYLQALKDSMAVLAHTSLWKWALGPRIPY